MSITEVCLALPSPALGADERGFGFLWASRAGLSYWIHRMRISAGTRWSEGNVVHSRCFVFFLKLLGSFVQFCFLIFNCKRIYEKCFGDMICRLDDSVHISPAASLPSRALCSGLTCCCISLPVVSKVYQLADRERVRVSVLIRCVCYSLMASMWWVGLSIHQSESGTWRQGTVFTRSQDTSRWQVEWNSRTIFLSLGMQILQWKSGISKQDSVYKHCRVSVGPPLAESFRNVTAEEGTCVEQRLTSCRVLTPDDFINACLSEPGHLEKWPQLCL